MDAKSLVNCFSRSLGLRLAQQKSNSPQSQPKELPNSDLGFLFAFYNMKFELDKCMSVK